MSLLLDALKAAERNKAHGIGAVAENSSDSRQHESPEPTLSLAPLEALGRNIGSTIDNDKASAVRPEPAATRANLAALEAMPSQRSGPGARAEPGVRGEPGARGEPDVRGESGVKTIAELRSEARSGARVEPGVNSGEDTAAKGSNSLSKSYTAEGIARTRDRSIAADRAAGAEADKQAAARALFTAKQLVKVAGVNATWLAAASVVGLVIAASAVYWWALRPQNAPVTVSTNAAAPPAMLPKPGPPLQPPASPALAPSSMSAAQPANTAQPTDTEQPPNTEQPADTAQGAAVALVNAAQPANTAEAPTAAPANTAVRPIDLASEAPLAPPGSDLQPAAVPISAEQQDAAAVPAGNGVTSAASSADAMPASAAEVNDTGASTDEAAVPAEIAAASGKKSARKKRAAKPGDKTQSARGTVRTFVLPSDGVSEQAPDAVQLQAEDDAAPPYGRTIARAALQLKRSAAAEAIDPDVAAGYEALIAGDLARARDRYRSAAESDPFNTDAQLGLASLASRLGDATGARRFYLRALELDPKNATAIAGLAAIGGSETLNSERALKNHLAQQPTSHLLQFALGNEFAAQGRWSEAQQAYFNAYSLDADNPDYAYNLAVSLDELNQGKAALPYYQRAAQLSAAREAHFDRKLVNQRIGDLSAR